VSTPNLDNACVFWSDISLSGRRSHDVPSRTKGQSTERAARRDGATSAALARSTAPITADKRAAIELANRMPRAESHVAIDADRPLAAGWIARLATL
jgi:hypothetical protein